MPRRRPRRTQYANNNAYNLDSSKNWIDWQASDSTFNQFVKQLIQFRNENEAFRPTHWLLGKDDNQDGVKDISWHTPLGTEADASYMDNPANRFLGYRLDAAKVNDNARDVKSIYVAYNGSQYKSETVTLPEPRQGMAWFAVADTSAWLESAGNFGEPRKIDKTYDMSPITVVIFVEKPN